MIRLNVFIQVEAEKKEEMLQIAKDLVQASQKDAGCIAYDLFASSTRSDVFMICETWTDETALAAHEKAAHFQTMVPKIQELAKMKLEKFTF